MNKIIIFLFTIQFIVNCYCVVNGEHVDASGYSGDRRPVSGEHRDDDIQYDQVVFDPNLPAGKFPDFDDFDSAESVPQPSLSPSSSSFTLSAPSSSSSPSTGPALISLHDSSNSTSNQTSSTSSSSKEASRLDEDDEAAESINLPVPSGMMDKFNLATQNHSLLANLTAQQKNAIVGDAFKRFVLTTQNVNKPEIDQKNDEADRLAALKSYLSHLKKEEIEKFKFPTSLNSDWVPLISTKAGNNYHPDHHQLHQQQPTQQIQVQHPTNHALEKTGKMLALSDSSSATTSSSTSSESSSSLSAAAAVKGDKALHSNVLNDANKIVQMYQENVNEILDDKNEQNHYTDKSNDGSFRKYLSCCDKLFTKYGTVDEKVYEDMYISPARYRFNPTPEMPLSHTIRTPISTSFYSYPLRQPSSYRSPMVQTYNLRAFPRNHIQTNVHLNSVPTSMSVTGPMYDPSAECFADPNHFYHTHRRLHNGFPHPYRSNYYRASPSSRNSWFARKKGAFFGRKAYFG